MRTIVALAVVCVMSVAVLLNRPHPNVHATDVIPVADGAAASPAGSSSSAEPALYQSSEDVRRAAEIRTVMLQDHRVAAVSDQVTIVVRGGHVTLQGRANSPDQKQAFEEDARSVAGVEQVENLLVVPGG